MKDQPFLSLLVGESGHLRERLREAETAVQRIEYSNFRKCQEAITELWGLFRYLEDLSERRFRQKEKILFPVVEHAQPQLQNFLDQLRHDHTVMRGTVRQIRRQLARFNATGESGEWLAVGRQALRLLSRHVAREQQALFPVVFQHQYVRLAILSEQF